MSKPVAKWNRLDRWAERIYDKSCYLLAHIWVRTMQRRFEDRWNENYFYGRTRRVVVRVEIQQKQPNGGWLMVP